MGQINLAITHQSMYFMKPYSSASEVSKYKSSQACIKQERLGGYM